MMNEQFGEVLARHGRPCGRARPSSRPPNNHVTVELMRDLADALDDMDAAQ